MQSERVLASKRGRGREKAYGIDTSAGERERERERETERERERGPTEKSPELFTNMSHIKERIGRRNSNTADRNPGSRGARGWARTMPTATNAEKSCASGRKTPFPGFSGLIRISVIAFKAPNSCHEAHFDLLLW